MNFWSGIKKAFFLVISFPLLVIVLFLLWFIPWVLVFHLGLLIYFPYEADGVSRFIRVAGPVVSLVNNSWVPEKELPEYCINALVASEDTRFFEHYGIDYESLEESFKYNQKKKKIKRGGSTITQQLVKNAFLSRNKTYVRKAREILGAVLLDVSLPKRDQLMWYFNIVEFGPNIYGIKNAARSYFKVDAKNLTPSQCIALVSILPNPKKWSQSLQKKNMSNFLQARYRTILSRMIILGNTSPKEIAFSKTHSPFGKQPLPSGAMPNISATGKSGVEAAAEFHDASDDEVLINREQQEIQEEVRYKTDVISSDPEKIEPSSETPLAQSIDNERKDEVSPSPTPQTTPELTAPTQENTPL